MTPEEFNDIVKRLYGERGGKAKLAREVDYTPQSINNWSRGYCKVPVIVARYLRLLDSKNSKNDA